MVPYSWRRGGPLVVAGDNFVIDPPTASIHTLNFATAKTRLRAGTRELLRHFFGIILLRQRVWLARVSGRSSCQPVNRFESRPGAPGVLTAVPRCSSGKCLCLR